MPGHGLKNCPRCDAPLAGGEKNCPQCGKPFSAPVGLVGGKPLTCPICKIPAYPSLMAGQDILHCAECGGTAYARETLSKMQPGGPKEIQIGEAERGHQTPPYFEPREKPPFLICPFCGKRMEEKKLAKISVDICKECRALWLDGEKYKFMNDLLGPYKWQTLSESKSRRSS
jgi:Zn-finger nucleic acid-binding protein